MPSTRRFSRGRRGSGGTRKRAVWVNIPFGNVAFTESVGNQVLLVPEDWEASFTGLSIESATLRAVVGQLVLQQTTVGTAGGNYFWGIYLAGANETAVPVFTTSGMSEVLWLRTGARSTSSVLTDSKGANTWGAVEPIEIRAKRKLTSATQISICAQFGADAASPAGVIGGLLRFLIARD